MKTDDNSPQIISARPAMTAANTGGTGLTKQILRALVHEFYAKIRREPVLGPTIVVRMISLRPNLDHMVE